MTNLTFYPVIRFPIDKDLSPLLHYLKGQRLVYRVTEEEGQQQLWVNDQAQAFIVAEYANRWASNELTLEEPPLVQKTASVSHKLANIIHLVRRLPVSLGAILLGFIGFLLITMDPNNLAYAEPFLYQPIISQYLLPADIGIAKGQYWRLLTPVFLHFSFLHILFNGMVLWQVGRRIELAQGSMHYLLVVLVIGLVSNVSQYLTQYFMQINSPFGGLSGVVYGVIGYVAIYQRYIKHPVLNFNEALIIVFIVFLLLGLFGVIDLFINGKIANAAHVSGFLSGIIIGRLMVVIDRDRVSR